MLSRFIQKDYLLFIALTSTIWLLITIGAAERFANIPVIVSSPSSIIGDTYLVDTAVAVNVEVQAKGIDALWLYEVEGEAVVLEEASFIQKDDHSYQVRGSDVLTALNTRFKGNYSFTISSKELLFPYESLQRVKLPIEISGINNVLLPPNFKWIEPLRVLPESVEVVGAMDAVNQAQLSVDLPEFYWEGAHALDVQIKGLGKDLATVESDRAEVMGASELWTEKKLQVALILGQQIIDVEVWVSGPKRALKNFQTEELVELSWEEYERAFSIVCRPLNPYVSVLSVRPNSIEKLDV